MALARSLAHSGPVITAGYRERPGRHPAVAAVWTSVTTDDAGSIIAADGCFDLIVRTSRRGQVSAFVYQPSARAHHATTLAGDRQLGVRVRPGYGAALLQHADLTRVATRVGADGPDALEAVVADLLEQARPPRIVTDFVEDTRASAGGLRLTGSTTAARQRELQRACRRWLGLGPKVFLRIERVWTARAAIGRGTALATVAAELGYADQAHLTREVHALIGVTPRVLRPVANLQDPATPRR